jgi:hypothetical protein
MNRAHDMKIRIGKIFKKIVGIAKLILQADEIIGLLKKDNPDPEKPKEDNPPQGGHR